MEEVGFEERLVGYESSDAIGNAPISLYSLAEIYEFLAKNSSSYQAWINLAELSKWVGEVLGDQDLQRAIEEAIKGHNSYFAAAKRVAQLIRERLDQARAVASA